MENAGDPWQKQIIGEDDARDRIAELKLQRLQIESELAALEDARSIITLHPAATPDRYTETVDALAYAPGGSCGSRGRPRIFRSRAEDLATSRQPVRPEVVTHVLTPCRVTAA